MSELDTNLRNIDREIARLQKERERIEAKQAEKEAQRAKLEELVKGSGYDSPAALVSALVSNFGLDPKAAKGGKRKRTKVTAELRDSIRGEVNGGTSMNKTAKKYEISYAVVVKIMKGEYDAL